MAQVLSRRSLDDEDDVLNRQPGTIAILSPSKDKV